MMRRTQALQIAAIIKQRFIAFVRLNVIDHGGGCDVTHALAHTTQRLIP